MPSGWSEESIAGKPCQILIPSQPDEHGYVVVYLHDRPPLDHVVPLAWRMALERRGLRVVAPLTGHSWWADRVAEDFDPQRTPEQFVIQDVVTWLGQHWQAVPPGLAICGIGMGGQAALRMAYKYPHLFPVTAAVSPDLDYQFRILEGDEVLYEMYGDLESARQDTAILHIHPLNWPRQQFFCCDPDRSDIFEGVDRLRMKLSSIGVPFEIDITSKARPGGSYEDAMAPAVVDYLVERLDRERLRVT